MLRSKVFAFTSSSEGFPNAIGEALAAGLPVVAYDCVAGPGDMVNDGENGYLIPLFDQDLFMEQLKVLMEDEDKRLAMSQAAQVSVKKFSINQIVSDYYHVITER